jgi:hypothetical protein
LFVLFFVFVFTFTFLSSAIITTFASLAFDQSRAKVVPTLWAWDQRAINFWFYFSKTGKSDNGSKGRSLFLLFVFFVF